MNIDNLPDGFPGPDVALTVLGLRFAEREDDPGLGEAGARGYGAAVDAAVHG